MKLIRLLFVLTFTLSVLGYGVLAPNPVRRKREYFEVTKQYHIHNESNGMFYDVQGSSQIIINSSNKKK